MLKRREAVKPLGIHTSMGYLHEFKKLKFRKWKDIPYLRENEGMLPPYIIAVGSRTRVMRAGKTLGLREPVFIDNESLIQNGLSMYGRTSFLVGVLEIDGLALPITIAETQMGCPATQIILRELMYYSRASGYEFFGQSIKSSGMQVIRAGTCAGVNSFDPDKMKVEIGDILIGTESFGSIGALIQSNVKMLEFMGLPRPIERGELSGLNFSHDGHHLKTSCSWALVKNLEGAAEGLGFKTKTGANFTKDSLYAEMSEDTFADLRDKYGTISTEMEQLVIDTLAADFRKAGINVDTGLILAAIGAIPGKSFPETREEQKKASEAEENILKIAARAFTGS
jgi:uridine phosphorylase